MHGCLQGGEGGGGEGGGDWTWPLTLLSMAFPIGHVRPSPALVPHSATLSSQTHKVWGRDYIKPGNRTATLYHVEIEHDGVKDNYSFWGGGGGMANSIPSVRTQDLGACECKYNIIMMYSYRPSYLL